MNDLNDFFQTMHTEIREQYMERIQDSGNDKPLFRSNIFTEFVLQAASESGMIDGEVVLCQHDTQIGKKRVKLDAYAIASDSNDSEDNTNVLDLFVTAYDDEIETVTEVPFSQIQKNLKFCAQFFQLARSGELSSKTDRSSEVYGLAETIRQIEFSRVRLFLLTNYKLSEKSKTLVPKEIDDQIYNVEIIDLERYYHHVDSGESSSDIIAEFPSGLPCVYIADDQYDYDCILCAVPAQALYDLYQTYGDRLLEFNVRSFLDQNGKVNKGIRDTLRTEPLRFMSYNNGIVITAQEVVREQQASGYCITQIKGLQIVNGGQTVASLFFTKKKFRNEVDLSHVCVTAKILILRPNEEQNLDGSFRDEFISRVSFCSNSQNKVKNADLSSNHPYHIRLEKLANSTYCPDGQHRWFYERGSGKYSTMLKLEGNTPAKLKTLKKNRPSNMKITKTDMSRYHYFWIQQPHIVSLGAEKCFTRFMETMKAEPVDPETLAPDDFKQLAAKAILYKVVHSVLLSRKEEIPSSLANVTAYLLSLMVRQYQDRLDLLQIWKRQNGSDTRFFGTSQEFRDQIIIWGKQVFDYLFQSSNGRQISEWAKKEACWTQMTEELVLTPPKRKIPELAGKTGR